MIGKRSDKCVCFGGYCYRGLCHQKSKPEKKRPVVQPKQRAERNGEQEKKSC